MELKRHQGGTLWFPPASATSSQRRRTDRWDFRKRNKKPWASGFEMAWLTISDLDMLDASIALSLMKYCLTVLMP